MLKLDIHPSMAMYVLLTYTHTHFCENQGLRSVAFSKCFEAYCFEVGASLLFVCVHGAENQILDFTLTSQPAFFFYLFMGQPWQNWKIRSAVFGIEPGLQDAKHELSPLSHLTFLHPHILAFGSCLGTLFLALSLKITVSCTGVVRD